MELSLTCWIVGHDESAFDVNVKDDMKVTKFDEAVKTQSAVTSSDCGHPQGSKQMNPTLYLKNVAHFGEHFQSQEGQVHVLVVIQKKLKNPDTKPAMTLADTPCLVFHFDVQKSFIHIPKAFVEGSGLEAEGEGLPLYLRQSLQEEWQALCNSVVEKYATLWVVGPPGTGKSCAAFAFACSTTRDDGWDVLWIHCSGEAGNLLCVLFRGEFDKQTCTIDRNEIQFLLSMLSEKAVVFLDGYVKTRDECVVLWPCQKWRQQNKEHHRLVVVCSMVSMGKDYRPETWKTIPF
ncbi:hypothetical protein GN244_ATG10211 [Phytophthora infestans]|uniref:Crinkler (CRN) family protein n=1 Tax=Phytophthora infestans TaxID=4787 RepID=A0A833WCS0_PHYIN|nr:hypothetical protein GN244_ATG10211 [Phytophthora infestans]